MSGKRYLGPPPSKIDFAVITAIPEELKAVEEVLALEPINEADNLVPEMRNYYFGRVTSKSGVARTVVCSRCRTSGNLPADSLAADMLERWKPRYLIMDGIAGGVARFDNSNQNQGTTLEGREGISPGDVVVHDSLVYYEKLKEMKEGYSPREVTAHHPSPRLGDLADQIINAGTRWHTKIQIPRPDGSVTIPRCVRGEILSGDKLLDNPDSPTLKRLLKRHPKAVAVDMESGGVGREAYERSSDMHVDFLVIRGISDYANIRESSDMRENWRDYAAYAAASFLLELISQMPISEEDVTEAVQRDPARYSEIELPKYTDGEFEESWPIPPEDTRASPPVQALRWIKYWRELSRIEFERMQRYAGERLVAHHRPHPLSVMYQREYQESEVKCDKLEGYYAPPSVVRAWDGRNHRLLSFLWNSPHVKAKRWANPPPSVRLAGFERDGAILKLKLQKCHYEDYIRTNLAANVKRKGESLLDYLQPGQERGGPLRTAKLRPVSEPYCCNIVGINVLVRSRDGKFLIRQRSAKGVNVGKKMYIGPTSGGMRIEGSMKWRNPSLFEAARVNMRQEMGQEKEKGSEFVESLSLVHLGATREFMRGGQTDFHFFARSDFSVHELMKIARKSEHRNEFFGEHQSPSGSELVRYLDHPASGYPLRGSIFLLHNSKNRDKFLYD